MKQGNFGFVLVVIVVALFYFIFINPTFHPFHPLKVSAIKLVPNGKLERGIFLVQRETKRLSIAIRWSVQCKICSCSKFI